MVWMMGILTIIALLLFLNILAGINRIGELEKFPAENHTELISVVIAAKDEEDSISSTIDSLLKQKQVDLEIIPVNDRSSDRTDEIIDTIARNHASVKPIHIKELPEGWLGKNHALSVGAEKATGTYIVFADADVNFSEDMLSKALACIKNECADHLTVAPAFTASSTLLKGFISIFLFGFTVLKRPWRANKNKRTGGIGIGAFQMIMKSCYQETGGYSRLRMRPDDDLAFGQHVKRLGYRQRIVTGLSDLKVEWYPDLKTAVRGLEKNVFAGFNYSILAAAATIIAVFVTHILPFILLIIGRPTIQIISLTLCFLLLCMYSLTTVKFTNFPIFIVLLLPLSASLILFTIVRSLWLTWKHKGIYWRGTHYSLKEMKQHFKQNQEGHR
ncbi:glycosyltransferase [Thalassobacillus hwangdonensis]|uniref:Glycosyltransferase n=1 Tax=Thalassobacillus hwangdonensis TaxID=546108 RepID=A0ABW3KYE8_9BACI